MEYEDNASIESAKSEADNVKGTAKANRRRRLRTEGKKQRRKLDDLLQDTPKLAVLVDTFEQRVQRPSERKEADRYYSGKKKQHTLKSQVAAQSRTVTCRLHRDRLDEVLTQCIRYCAASQSGAQY